MIYAIVVAVAVIFCIGLVCFFRAAKKQGPVAGLRPKAPAKEGPERPPRFTREQYEAGLLHREKTLRQALSAALADRATNKLGRLEIELETVCEKLASIELSWKQAQPRFEEIRAALSRLRNELPDQPFAKAFEHLQVGDFEAVELFCDRLAGRFDSNSNLAALAVYQAGVLAEGRIDFFGAMKYYRRAVALKQDNPDYLRAAGMMARLLGEDREAKPWLEKYLQFKRQEGDESLDLALAQHELALILDRTGLNNQAEPLYRQSMAIREKIQGKDHPDLGPVLHDLAALYESSGRYEQSARLYKRSIELTEKGLGADYPRIGQSLDRLAGLYEEMEQEELALPLYSRALEIKKRVLGEDHPDVWAILNSLAGLYRLEGKPDQAEAMYQRSLAIAEKALGKDHPNLAVILNNLAELYNELGRTAEAEQFQERAFALFEFGGPHDDFVEMEKDHEFDIEEVRNQKVAGK